MSLNITMGASCNDPIKKAKSWERKGKYSLGKSASNSDCVLNGWETRIYYQSISSSPLIIKPGVRLVS